MKGRRRTYSEPLSERLTTEFTPTLRRAIRRKCAGKLSEADYIRGLVCKDLNFSPDTMEKPA